MYTTDEEILIEDMNLFLEQFTDNNTNDDQKKDIRGLAQERLKTFITDKYQYSPFPSYIYSACRLLYGLQIHEANMTLEIDKILFQDLGKRPDIEIGHNEIINRIIIGFADKMAREKYHIAIQYILNRLTEIEKIPFKAILHDKLIEITRKVSAEEAKANEKREIEALLLPQQLDKLAEVVNGDDSQKVSETLQELSELYFGSAHAEEAVKKEIKRRLPEMIKLAISKKQAYNKPVLIEKEQNGNGAGQNPRELLGSAQLLMDFHDFHDKKKIKIDMENIRILRELLDFKLRIFSLDECREITTEFMRSLESLDEHILAAGTLMAYGNSAKYDNPYTWKIVFDQLGSKLGGFWNDQGKLTNAIKNAVEIYIHNTKIREAKMLLDYVCSDVPDVEDYSFNWDASVENPTATYLCMLSLEDWEGLPYDKVGNSPNISELRALRRIVNCEYQKLEGNSLANRKALAETITHLYKKDIKRGPDGFQESPENNIDNSYASEPPGSALRYKNEL